MDNRTAAEERSAAEKRKHAAEELRATRDKAAEMTPETADALDSLLEKLRNGETIRRGHQRSRPNPTPAAVVPLNMDNPNFALDLLASMQSGGFELPVPSSPTFAASQRRRRNRRQISTFSEESSGTAPTSPLAAEVDFDYSEAEETSASESGHV